MEHAYGGKYEIGPFVFNVNALQENEITLSQHSVYSSIDVSVPNAIKIEMDSNYIIDYYAAIHSISSPSPDYLTLVVRVNGVAEYYSAVTGNFDTNGYVTLIGQIILNLKYGDVVSIAVVSSHDAQLELINNQSAKLFVQSLDDTYYYYSSVTEAEQYNRLARVRRNPVRSR